MIRSCGRSARSCIGGYWRRWRQVLPGAERMSPKRCVTMRSRPRTGRKRTATGTWRRQKAFARSAFPGCQRIFPDCDGRGRQAAGLDSARSSGRSTCASRRGFHLLRLETSSSGSALVATRKRAPRKSAMNRDGLASITIRAAALNFYGTPYEAITAGEQAVALAERLADANWLGFAEYGLGQAYFIAGRYRDAELYLDQASARFANAPEMSRPGRQDQAFSCFVI